MKRSLKYSRKWRANKVKNDPVWRSMQNIRGGIHSLFSKNRWMKENRSIDILGLSPVDFKEYIEKQFEPWMNWDNYGKYNGEFNYGWDIDHIIPVSKAKTVEDAIKLNHYTNLQPLCSKTNRDIKRNNFV